MAEVALSDPSLSFSLLKELPQEVLLIVLRQLRNRSSPSSFLSYLLICRRWCDLGLRLLYDVIILRNSNLESFLTGFSHANLFLVKSLTIRIDPVSPKVNSAGRYEEDGEEIHDTGSSESRALWGQLERLVAVIRKMNTLSTFSFIVASQHLTFAGFWIPSPIIASMLENLSKSCVSLEIDTAGKESARFSSVHLCDKTRAVLPRLQHFRVRLYRVCPAMFFSEVDEDGAINRHSIAQFAPSLKTVIISCDMPYGHDQWVRTARVCGHFGQPISHADRFVRSESRRSLVAALREFFLRGNYPEIERLWLIDSQRSHPSKHEAFFRRDILLDKTWVIPRVRIATSWSSRGPQRRSILNEHLLTRTPEGHDVLSSRGGAENVAEAQTWQETIGGCRMPAGMMATDYLPREVLPFESEQAYQLRRSEVSCSLWVHEKVTGHRLLHAFECQGLIDSPPVNEIIPNGWQRSDGNWNQRAEAVFMKITSRKR